MYIFLHPAILLPSIPIKSIISFLKIPSTPKKLSWWMPCMPSRKPPSTSFRAASESDRVWRAASPKKITCIVNSWQMGIVRQHPQSTSRFQIQGTQCPSKRRFPIDLHRWPIRSPVEFKTRRSVKSLSNSLCRICDLVIVLNSNISKV